MSILNQILRATFDAILYPFKGFPPIVGVAFVSLVFGVLALLVIKRVSNQEAIAAVKERIYGGLFEIRLFNDDFRSILRAQGEILRHNMTYLGLNLVPLVVLLPLFVFVAAQLEFHYGYTGLEIGEDTLVKVQLADDWQPGDSVKPDLTLEVPAGFEIETPAVWAADLKEMAWRLEAREPGSYEFNVHLDGESWTKAVEVSDAITRRAPARLAPTFLDQLLYPAEAALPKGAPVRSISIEYPSAEVSFLGFEWHWLIWFLILSIAFAFALKNKLGVTL